MGSTDPHHLRPRAALAEAGVTRDESAAKLFAVAGAGLYRHTGPAARAPLVRCLSKEAVLPDAVTVLRLDQSFVSPSLAPLMIELLSFSIDSIQAGRLPLFGCRL